MEIVPLSSSDRRSLVQLYRAVTKGLQKEGIDQWDWFYPNRFIIARDLSRHVTFGIKDQQGQVIGAVVVDQHQSESYNGLPWADQSGAPSCIHRLAVHPEYQGKGIGKLLLQFAEERASEQGATSMRLDVYSANPGAVRMYEKAGYVQVGSIRFPRRKHPYSCMEKLLHPSG